MESWLVPLNQWYFVQESDANFYRQLNLLNLWWTVTYAHLESYVMRYSKKYWFLETNQ